MLEFLTSRSRSLRSRAASRGFTLIELVITAAIIAIISAIVIVRFSAFDSTVLLKSAAYEIATTIRDAQVYSVSVVRSGGTAGFDAPYGVTFTPTEQRYTFFRYDDGDPTHRPYYDIGEPDPDVASIKNVYTLQRSIEVAQVCVHVSGQAVGADDCTSASSAHLDISFRRPEFKALFYASWFGGAQNTIESAKIYVHSRNGGDTWIIEIGLLGHISVKKQP